MSGRLFRWLLRLLPFDFRADYGREIERSFREQQREAGTVAGRVRVWATNVGALAAVGPREHVSQLRQDVGYAVRMMRRDRGFVAVALLTLALGTGANTAIFSVVHAVLLEPLPYGDPSRLVSVMNRWEGQPRGGLSIPEYLDYDEHSEQLEIAALASGTTTISGGAGDPERLNAAIATTNLFDVLGRQPALGRGFRVEESAADSRVVVISDALWRSRFGADPSIVGRAIDIGGTPQTVIGVLPPGLVLPIDVSASTPSAVIVPLALDRGASRAVRGGHYLAGVGRVAPGASIESAQAEMATIVERLVRQYPEEVHPKGFGIVVRLLRDDLLGDSGPVLWTLSAAVMLVLLLACANVANLMLARGETRRRELSVRAALGASRFRMVRQLVTEALILSLAGTALGLLVAKWAHAVMLATGPTVLPRLSGVSLSVPVLLFAAALATLTTLLFGVLPAWHLSRANAGDALKDGVRGNAGGRTRARTALVVSQVGLAMILLVAAGLLIKSFGRLMNVPSGLQTEQVLTARLTAPAARYPGLPDVSGFFTRLLERTRSLPGVEAAGAGSGLPFAVSSGDWGFDIEGRPRINNRKPGRADWYVVTPGYFEALRIPVVEGRAPNDSDTEQAPPIILLNQSAAAVLFPAGDAVGKRVKLSNTTGPEQPWRTIAGVVGDVRQGGLDEQVRTEMFIPYRQFQHFSANVQARAMTLVVRTAGEPTRVVSAIRGELRAMDPQVPLADVQPMTEVLARSVADRRLNMLLIGSFALLAIVLATVGVYGLIAYDVLQRTREIGIRMALGASRKSVLSLVMKRGMTLVIAGAVVGLTAAALVTGQLSALLFEVGPRDVTVFSSVALLLAAAGALASYLPAWRATRVDPLAALRND